MGDKRRLVRRNEGIREIAWRKSMERKTARSHRRRKKRISFVEPLRDINDFDKLISELEKDNKIKEALLLQVMYLTHLRVSDALILRFRDFIKKDGSLNNEVVLIEKKTGKSLRIRMFDALGEIILNYYVRYGSPRGDWFIFRSDSYIKQYRNVPWHRSYVWRFVKKYAKKAGIEENLGTHTFRKTWAYHAYMDGEMDIEEIMHELGHNNIRDTLIYCGIDDEVRKAHYEAMGEKVVHTLHRMRFENLPPAAETYKRAKRSRKRRKNEITRD
jgi:integrase